jgi:DNA-directed RNA polymerase specialized sigma24 family protein
MSFPPTSRTLIQRLAEGGDTTDWHAFLADYWEPICRFARHSGQLQWPDAEDVAAEVLEVVVRNRLLARWVGDRSARLRTLLCCVARNILANRARVKAGRSRLLRGDAAREHLAPLAALDAPAEQLEAFDAAWAEGLVRQAMESLIEEYHAEGKGDTVRVLYGRLCEGQTAAAVAEALGLTLVQSENAYKHARKRLGERLEALVREHVGRYCTEGEAEAEFTAEWGRLAELLRRGGGLESAVRRVCATAGLTPPNWQAAFSRLREML